MKAVAGAMLRPAARQLGYTLVRLLQEGACSTYFRAYITPTCSSSPTVRWPKAFQLAASL